MPKDQISTLGPYSLRVTTSGAIQYGVPTIVVRFECAGSEICAQNPKSAVKAYARQSGNPIRPRGALTELDIPLQAQEHIIALDISMNDPMAM